MLDAFEIENGAKSWYDEKCLVVRLYCG